MLRINMFTIYIYMVNSPKWEHLLFFAHTESLNHISPGDLAESRHAHVLRTNG